jgi:hypothetical protein
MERKTLVAVAAVAGFLLILANGFVVALMRQANQAVELEATATADGVREASNSSFAESPSINSVTTTVNPTPTPAVSAARAIQLVLQHAPDVTFIGEPTLVRTEHGLAWQLLTSPGVVLVHSDTGAILYDGRPVRRAVDPTSSAVSANGSSVDLTVPDSFQAPQPVPLVAAPAQSVAAPAQPTQDVTPSSLPVSLSAADAAAIALAWAPGSTVVGVPELVIFEGTLAYEVIMDTGVLYIDANTSRVLYDGTTATPVKNTVKPKSNPKSDDHEDDHHENDDHHDHHETDDD